MLGPRPPGSGWRLGPRRAARGPPRRAARRARPATPGTISTSAAAVGSPSARTASRSGSSSTSPAAPMLPPTTIRSGLKRLQRFAAAVPTWRPASAIARRQPASPSAARASTSPASRSSPQAAAQQLDHRRPGGEVSRQPRLPQRQMSPRLVEDRVADLARRAAGAVEQAPVDDQPGADAGGHLEVDEVARTPARRPSALGQRAEVGVVVDVDGQAEAAPHLVAARTPTQPGRMDAEPTVPVDRWIGPGSPRPTPSTRSRRHAGLAQQLAHELGGGVQALGGGVVVLHLAPALGQHRV